MKKNTVIILFLLLTVWFSTTGFRGAPQPAALPQNEVSAVSEPAVLAAVTFGKVSPISGSTGQATNGLVLSWDAVSGVSNVTYRYCVSTKSNKCPAGKWINVGTKTSVTLKNLLPGKKYYWWVRAYSGTRTVLANADGGTAWNFTTSGLPGALQKSSPSINATNQVVTDLGLSWTSSNGAASYEYCIDAMYNTTCDTKWVNVGNNLSATLSSITNNTKYYWQVRAVNPGGTTQANNGTWWAFTTVVLPGLFEKLSPLNGATGMTITGQTLNWMISDAASSYDYCYGLTSGSCTSWTSTAANTNITLGALAYDTTYYWQARAKTSGAPVEASGGWWSFTTQVAPPAAFGKATPTSGATDISNNPTLTWNAATGSGISYEYCIYDTLLDVPCADTEWTPTTGDLSTDVVGLDPNSTYSWQVRAVNSTGQTEANNGVWWTFKTENVPGSFTKATPTSGSTVTSNTPTLTWNAPTGTNLTYQVCYDTTNDNICDNNQWSAETTSLSFTTPTLNYSTKYYWQVQVQNSAGAVLANGDTASAWWNFTTPPPPPVNFMKLSPDNGLSGVALNQPLTWEVNETGDTFQYCLDPDTNTQCDTGWVPASSGVVPTLAYATTYSWQVQATNPTGTTEADDGWWTFTTQAAPTTAFEKIAPLNGAGNVPLSQTLRWNQVVPGATYQYCLDADTNGKCDSGWVPASSGVKPTLAYGTTYSWQVQAINGGTTDADGGWWTFTTKIAPPKAFTKTAPTSGTGSVWLNQTLTWDQNDPTATYKYCLDTLNDNQCQTVAQGGTGWVPANSGVTPTLKFATTYYWQVRATNSSATTQASDGWWSFTTMTKPVAPVSSDQTFDFNEDQTPFTGQLTFTGQVGIPVTFVQADSIPNGVFSLASDGSFTYTPIPDYNGTVTFQFDVSDGINPPSATYTTTLIIHPQEDAPVLAPIPNKSVLSGASVSFTAPGSDVDGPDDTLTYNITNLPANATFSETSGVFSWAPIWSPAGPNTYSFTITVTDLEGQQASQDFTITVLPRQMFQSIIRK